MAIVGSDSGLFTPGEPTAARAGYAGLGAANYTSEDLPFAYSMLDAVPGVSTATAWNIGRVQNTIIGGGKAGRFKRAMLSGANPYHSVMDYTYSSSRGRGGMFGIKGGGITQTSPGHLFRLTRPANIDPSFYGAKSGIYSPFGSLSGMGNALFDRGSKLLKGNAATAAHAMSGAAPRVADEKLFAPGTLGRISAMGTMSRMSSDEFARKSVNMRAAISDINPKYYKDTFAPALRGLEHSGAGDDALRFAYRSGIGSTLNSGRISGRIGGYIQGAEAAYKGRAALHGALSTATQGHFLDGLHAGAKAVLGPDPTKLGKFVGRGAATSLLRGVNTAGWVLLAHDLALGAGKLIGAGVDTALGAAKSTLGSINKGVMGMGFKDNAVAATSRQRGVMAIQNSRLNARSALGAEGAMMAAHFG